MFLSLVIGCEFFFFLLFLTGYLIGIRIVPVLHEFVHCMARQPSSFTPLEAGLVQEGTDFLMEEYTFRLYVLYYKDLGQLDKSVGELLPSQIEGLVQDGHLQNAHASLLQALHGACPAYGLTVK